ncbi:MAG TPA: DNA mismatch repair protein MutS [Acetobacteraceae bacterium]|nr:DNA mismatch repair protein MutS [Acetobacteraceae bacterium]
MNFRSVLYPGEESGADVTDEPPFFSDLNLDQIIDAITANKAEYNLKPLFYTPPGTLEAIRYRHEVMRDLEDEETFSAVTRFSQRMRRMREELERSRKLYYKQQKEWWFLDAVTIYCEAVEAIRDELEAGGSKSRGLQRFRAWLIEYLAGFEFSRLAQQARRIYDDLEKIEYCLLIRDSSVTVREYEGEIDYSQAVEESFRKFARGEGKDYRVNFPEPVEMNHVEAAVLNFVVRLYPDLFAELERFCAEQAEFLDPIIRDFDREVQFYVSYLDYIRPLAQAGLALCYPHLSTANKEISIRDGFDLALARKLSEVGQKAVCNDFQLSGRERIIIVSGPNQGGKTTFARMFGQLHYLANLGLLVPGRQARLILFDHLFTHFEREERVENLRSKFEDDLLRVHDILDRVTPRSVVVMNESFSTTTLKDAIFIGKQVMGRIIARDLICVFVTFVEELARLSDTTVSMVSTIIPGDPASRTYRIVRRPADGRAYAIAIAEKYRLTYEMLKERIRA